MVVNHELIRGHHGRVGLVGFGAVTDERPASSAVDTPSDVVRRGFAVSRPSELWFTDHRTSRS
jgi:hypothetical protein